MKKLILFFSLLFSRFLNYYKSSMNKARPFLQKELPAAIEAVQFLKTILDNTAMDLLTAFIPGNLDDIALKACREFLPLAILNLGIANGIAQGKSNDEIIQATIEWLRKLKLIDKSKHGKILLDLAADISHALTDGKLSLSELAGILHGLYEAEYKQAA